MHSIDSRNENIKQIQSSYDILNTCKSRHHITRQISFINVENILQYKVEDSIIYVYDMYNIICVISNVFCLCQCINHWNILLSLIV